MVPLTYLGAISLWYNGTSTETAPTPTPAKNLPANNHGISAEQTWKMTPRLKTAMARIRPLRRPQKSPIGAESNAPIIVPKLRIATIKDDWLGDKSGWSSPFRWPVEN